jgi:hypothetical protein
MWKRSQETRQEGGPRGDVPADQVRVRLLHCSRVMCLAREDPFAEAGRESLDLSLDCPANVDGRAVRDVTVGPGRVLADRRASVVEEALLREQDEGPLGVPSLPRRALGFGDLGRRAAEMDGGGARNLGGAPRDRAVERVVDLEDARAVAPTLEAAAVGRREEVAGEREQLPRRDVADDDVAAREVAQRGDGMSGLDLAAEFAQPCSERVGDRLRAAARKRPAVRVRETQEAEPEAGSALAFERQDRMRRGSQEQRLGMRRRQPFRDGRRLAQRARGETPCSPRRSCQARDRSQKERRDLDRGADEPRVLRAERVGRALDEERRSVVERMRERGRRFDPLDVETELAEERRCGRERVDRRADVVSKPGKRQLERARAAADRVLRLEDEDGPSGLGESDGGSEPVRARADDDRV